MMWGVGVVRGVWWGFEGESVGVWRWAILE